MKFIRAAVCCFIFNNIFLLSLYAQSGNIAGTVTDSSLRGVLVGAQVQAEGQGTGVPTDASGRYLLLGVPAGKLKVTVSYLGLSSSSAEVSVAAGETATQDFSLALSASSTEVTVTQSPDIVGQARALNDQMNSINLVNVVASDQIGAFPDTNAAEATQRIPGIAVQRDQGEGRYVLIRGTEPRLSATTINGERIGTTENTSRQIPLDTIPADLLGAIEITKVLMPDTEADSIGGRVNLITKRAPSTRHAALTVATGYNTLVRDDIKDYNGTYGQRLFGDRLGFIVSGNYYQNNRGSQDLEPAYNTNQSLNSLDLRDYVLTRTRKGGTWDVDYRLKPGSELFFRGLLTEYEDAELRYRLRELTANGRLERNLRDRYHDSHQTALMLGGTHPLPGSWLVSWNATYSKAVQDTPYRLEGTFRQTGVTFAPNVTPTFIDPSNIQASPQNQNLSNFNFIQDAIQNDKSNEQNVAGGFDMSVPLRFGPSAASLLKFGMKIRDEDRDRRVDTLTQTPASGVTLKLTDYSSTSYGPADNFLGGKYPEFASTFPDRDALRALSHGGSLTSVVGATGDSGSYDAKERVIAGYVMDEISLSDHTVLVPGVRFEATDTTYSAPQYLTGAGGAVLSRTVVSGTSNYNNVMPGIHLRHELFEDTPLRISYSRGLARPNYSDLAPFILQDSSALTISKGNPELKVTDADNIDVSVEHYFKSVGIASAGYFFKHLGDYAYPTSTQELVGTDLYRVTQPVNGDKATIHGVELSLVRQLDFLPHEVRGFTIYTNYTHVKSDATLPRGDFILPGQASDMGNLSVAFERKGFSARASFNYQGRYILGIGDSAATDNWLDDRVEIDFSASMRINKYARIFVDALNLGNEPYRVYAGGSSYAIQEERYKMWAIGGLKFDF